MKKGGGVTVKSARLGCVKELPAGAGRAAGQDYYLRTSMIISRVAGPLTNSLPLFFASLILSCNYTQCHTHNCHLSSLR